MQRVNPEDLRVPHGDRIEKRFNVLQGTSQVTADRNVVLTTVLGSCIATCLYDPIAHIGGMNHFLLSQPAGLDCADAAESQRYGVYAMEVLINDMLKAGAIRSRLRAHLYGGANLHAGMKSIGTANARFAEEFLRADGIPLVHSHLGGNEARRVDFRAASGQARCRVVHNVVVQERKVEPAPVAKGSGDVELF